MEKIKTDCEWRTCWAIRDVAPLKKLLHFASKVVTVRVDVTFCVSCLHFAALLNQVVPFDAFIFVASMLFVESFKTHHIKPVRYINSP